MNDLEQRSLEIILKNQASTGAFIACPTFETYQYCWFRDGAFIAHAALLLGEMESTRRFELWCAGVVERYRPIAERVIDMLEAGQSVGERDFLPTRFTLQGVSVEDNWTNFQLDGYGTWLWGLGEYMQRTGDTALMEEIRPAVALTVRYLIASWRTPCYDCWEEHLNYIHPYTLGAISAGISAVRNYLPELVGSMDTAISEIDAWLKQNALRDAQVIKMIPTNGEQESAKSLGVDASLIGLFVPYGIFTPDSTEAQSTIARIEQDIHHPGGGVYRYPQDTYYGGGEWLLLACWLGWYYAENGQHDKAADLLKWVESQADAQGQLSEQVLDHMLAPVFLEEWEQRWGKNANPLLWSHAMLIILTEALYKK